MNIAKFAAWLNKRKNLHIDSSYYAYIDTWKRYWQGYVPDIHDIRETASDGTIISRRMSSLRIPKHVCEDWATLLVNDKTLVKLEDNGSAAWLTGNDDQTGGLLRELSFWPNANRLVELAFRSGTGAFVMSLSGLSPGVDGGLTSDGAAQIALDYLPAECILPLTVRHGTVVDAAFASEVMVDGKAFIYLQTHLLQNGEYLITNEYFQSTTEDADSAEFKPVPLPAGMAASLRTGTDIPWFSVFSPAGVKNIRGGTGLGMAVFSEALDAAAQVDLAFDNYHQDLFLGGKKVFYNKRLTQSYVGSDGEEHFVPPDAVRRQVFFQLPGGDLDDSPDWHEYNPDLRVNDNSTAVQDALDYFSFKCGLGTHHYQFNADNIATATQYAGERQDMVQHANRHWIQIEAALIRIFRAMLWAGKTLLGADVDPDGDISIVFDDSYITDTESRLAAMKDDALSGLLPPYRYLMERYGMSEEDARTAVQEAQQSFGSREGLSFGGGF